MITLSKYFSDDGRAVATVELLKPTYTLRVTCTVNDVVVTVINTFTDAEDAENFAEDFVLNKNKKNKNDDIARQLAVLHSVAEPNERDSQPCMG
jgi:hypothetical protein